jgi:hypothetical protein
MIAEIMDSMNALEDRTRLKGHEITVKKYWCARGRQQKVSTTIIRS